MARPVVFSRVFVALSASLSVAGGACSSGAKPPSTRTVPERECAVVPLPATPIESATVVVTSPVNLTNAPHFTTWGERFVFDLAYDTRLHFDCQGRPLGSPRYRARELGPSTFLLEPVDSATEPRLTVRSAGEARARDLVDAGVDLLITDSPALATYAATRGDVVSIASGWDRTWVLATGRGAIGLDSSVAFRAGLARDVVRADARAAQGAYWWTDTTGCDAPKALSPLASVGTARVAYPRDETVARALAERIVAVVGSRATAVGLAPNAFASELRGGGDVAYVFSLPRQSRDRCRDIRELLSSASWLGAPGAIVPLVDTRLRAVARRDRLNVGFTWDSTLTVLPLRP